MSSSHLRHQDPVGQAAGRRLRRSVPPVLAVVAALAVAAACSSSSGSTPKSSGGAGGSGSSDSGVATAQTAFQARLKGVSGLGDLDQPLKSKPAAGKLIVEMSGTPSVTAGIYDNAFKEATAAVGWKLKTIPFELADPSTLAAGLDTAMQFHPVAVTIPGVDPKLYAASAAKLKAAGIPIIGMTVPTLVPSTNPPVLNVEGSKNLQAVGTAVADWFIADSGGKGNALILSIPAYPLFKIMSDAFQAEVAKNCPDCKAKTLDLTIQSVAAQAIPGEVVSTLRRDRSIDYIAAMDGSFLNGLSSALQAAGLAQQVKLGGGFLRPNNFDEVKSGVIHAMAQQSTAVQAWAGVDAALRISEGMPLPTDAYDMAPPFSMVDKSNIGSLQDPLDSPQNYRDLFKKLWLVG
jgi:ribose transport system substrate-binding protein